MGARYELARSARHACEVRETPLGSAVTMCAVDCEPFSKTFSMKAVFCVRNGSVTPREEGFAKQPQVMLLGGWSTEDVV